MKVTLYEEAMCDIPNSSTRKKLQGEGTPLRRSVARAGQALWERSSPTKLQGQHL